MSSNLISSLEAARNSLTPETWHKGSYFSNKNNTLCMCSHGALQAQVNPACREVINRSGSERQARGMAKRGAANSGKTSVSNAVKNEALTKVLNGTQHGNGSTNDPTGIAADACIDVSSVLNEVAGKSVGSHTATNVAVSAKEHVVKSLNETTENVLVGDGEDAYKSAQEVADAAAYMVKRSEYINVVHRVRAIDVASYANNETVAHKATDEAVRHAGAIAAVQANKLVTDAKASIQGGAVVADDANDLVNVANEASAAVSFAATTTVEGALFVDIANKTVDAANKANIIARNAGLRGAINDAATNQSNLDTLRSIWDKRSSWVKDDYKHNNIVYGNKDAHYLLSMVGLTAAFNDRENTTLEMVHQKFDEAIELARQLNL